MGGEPLGDASVIAVPHRVEHVGLVVAAECGTN